MSKIRLTVDQLSNVEAASTTDILRFWAFYPFQFLRGFFGKRKVKSTQKNDGSWTGDKKESTSLGIIGGANGPTS